MADEGGVPLGSGGGGSVHGELPHGALLQVLLLPLGHVSLQGQDLLLLLPQLLGQPVGTQLGRPPACGARLPLKQTKKDPQRR